jgi:hypothetical protein
MNLVKLFQFATTTNVDGELPTIYTFGVNEVDFVRSDIINIFTNILTDCVERTQGIPEKDYPAFWDNCLASEANKGLITLIAEAIADKQELFLVYVAGVLRRADGPETSKIREDYKKNGSSSAGVYISFKNYRLSDILKIYSGMEYSALCSLGKTMAVAKSVQFKMAKMRRSVWRTP